MKHLKYLLLLLFIVLFTPNAYAYTYDVTNKITAMSGSGSTGGHYLGLEIYNSGSQNNYTVNTRYNGTLSNIEFNLPLPIEADECFTTNMEYTVTMEMATSDWRNHFARPYVGADSSSTNWATTNVTFVSMKKIYFKFKIPASESLCYGFVYVRLSSPSVSSTAFTGVTNWNLSKISLSDQYSSSGGGSSSGSTTPPTPTANPNQDIIDNDNQNTNDIIENNNQNTQNIIDNQNELLGNKCTNILDFPFSSNNPYSLTATSNDYFVNSNYYIDLKSGIIYNFSFKSNYNFGPTGSSVQVYLYRNGAYQNLGSKSGTFTVSNTGSYRLRFDCNNNGDTCTFYDFMISESTKNYCEYGSFSSKLDDTNNAINGVNDSITNDNIDSDVGSDFFDSFTNNMHGLSSIITIPLQSIQLLTNSQCTPLTLPIPFTNKNITLPCMTEIYQQHVPVLLTLLRTCWLGIISYKALIDIFAIVKGFKDPDSDKIEVLDL